MKLRFFFYVEPRDVVHARQAGHYSREHEIRCHSHTEAKARLRLLYEGMGLSRVGIREVLKTVRVETKRFPRPRRLSKRAMQKFSQKRLFKKRHWDDLYSPKTGLFAD